MFFLKENYFFVVEERAIFPAFQFDQQNELVRDIAYLCLREPRVQSRDK